MTRTIITYGTFDLFHHGHVRILRRAKDLGDRLIVGVSTDEFNLQKGKRSYLTFEQRCEVVQSCRYVDLTIPEKSWCQKASDIVMHSVDVFVMGDDWKGKFDDLSAYCDVIYLRKTDGISSTMLREWPRGIFQQTEAFAAE